MNFEIDSKRGDGTHASYYRPPSLSSDFQVAAARSARPQKQQGPGLSKDNQALIKEDAKMQLFLASLISYALIAVPPFGPELRALALSSRMSIQSADTEINLTREATGQPTSKIRIRSWVDGEKYRMDMDRYGLPGAESAPRRETQALNDKEYISFLGDKSIEGTPLAMSIVFRKAYAAEERGQGLDVRKLGVAPLGILSEAYDLQNILARRDLIDETVESAEIDGVSCWKVAFRTQQGPTISLWICPERGYFPLRVEARADPAKIGYEFVGTVNSTIQAFGSPSIWYPVRLRFAAMESGKLSREEVDEITVHSLNQKIAPDVFTLAGIAPPEGTHAIITPSTEYGNLMIWDGKRLSVPPPSMPAKPDMEDNPGFEQEGRDPWARYSLIALGLTSGLIAAVLVWRMFRPR